MFSMRINVMQKPRNTLQHDHTRFFPRFTGRTDVL